MLAKIKGFSLSLAVLLCCISASFSNHTEFGFGSSYGWYLAPPAPKEFWLFNIEPLYLFINPIANRLFSPCIETGWAIVGERDGNIREGTLENNTLVFSDEGFTNKNIAHLIRLRPLLIIRPATAQLAWYGLAGLEGSLTVAAHQTLYGSEVRWKIGEAPTPFPGIKLNMELGGGIDYVIGRWKIGLEFGFSFFLARFFRSATENIADNGHISLVSVNSAINRPVIAAGLPGEYHNIDELPPVFTLRVKVTLPDYFKTD